MTKKNLVNLGSGKIQKTYSILFSIQSFGTLFSYNDPWVNIYVSKH